MSDKPENPSAFPLPGVYDQARDQVDAVAAYGVDAGMTLRDYFAIRAPITSEAAEASLARDGRSLASHSEIYLRQAQMQYAYADAMLKARQA